MIEDYQGVPVRILACQDASSETALVNSKVWMELGLPKSSNLRVAITLQSTTLEATCIDVWACHGAIDVCTLFMNAKP
jgi:hypothetical protein